MQMNAKSIEIFSGSMYEVEQYYTKQKKILWKLKHYWWKTASVNHINCKDSQSKRFYHLALFIDTKDFSFAKF